MPINWSTKSYSKEDFTEAWKTSLSIAQVLMKLGYAQGGGSYDTIRKAAEELGLDSSHMLGQSHMRGKRAKNIRPLSELLVRDSRVGKLKERLLREGILEKECSICSLVEWNGKPAPLELDHIDGDNRNNELQNLRIVCPNCHAQTDTYKGKNIAKRSSKSAVKRKSNTPSFCVDCSKQISGRRSTRCPSCSGLTQRKIQWPNADQLVASVTEHGYSKVSRDLGVSDNAVRKHIKRILNQASVTV